MRVLRWLVRLQRACGVHIGWHHIMMMSQVAVIVLISISVAGCSSYSSMTEIYLLGLSYRNTALSHLDTTEEAIYETLRLAKGDCQLEVRTGYFGICVRQSGVVWLCSSDNIGLTQQVGSRNDPLNLIGTASDFRDQVLFSGILFMAIVLMCISTILLATFPGWHQERDEQIGSDVDVKPLPSRPVTHAAMTAAMVAAVLLLIASLWQHVGSVAAAAMVENMGHGNVKANIGTNAMVMVWAGFAVECFAAVGLVGMIAALIVLDRLTDD